MRAVFSLSQQRSRNEEHSVVCTSPNVTRDVKTKNFLVNSLSCPYAYVKKTGQPSFDDRAFR